MKSKLLITLVVVLAVLSIVLLYKQSESEKKIDRLIEQVQQLPKEPVVYNGKDGYTPKLGVDYFLPKNGKDGLNSISFVTTQTILKDVPLAGTSGKSAYDIWIDAGNVGTEIDFLSYLRGSDTPTQQLRVDLVTGNLQSKLSSWDSWNTLLYCADYRLVCPNVD